jgi:hypothetical protein
MNSNFKCICDFLSCKLFNDAIKLQQFMQISKSLSKKVLMRNAFDTKFRFRVCF